MKPENKKTTGKKYFIKGHVKVSMWRLTIRAREWVNTLEVSEIVTGEDPEYCVEELSKKSIEKLTSFLLDHQNNPVKKEDCMFVLEDIKKL